MKRRKRNLEAPIGDPGLGGPIYGKLLGTDSMQDAMNGGRLDRVGRILNDEDGGERKYVRTREYNELLPKTIDINHETLYRDDSHHALEENHRYLKDKAEKTHYAAEKIYVE